MSEGPRSYVNYVNMSKKSDLEYEFLFWVRTFKLPEPEQEYKFHPTRKWRFDFAWPEKMIAVEIEGGIWVGGGHNRPKAFLKDIEKYNNASLLGWRVFRFAVKSGEKQLDPDDVEMLKEVL